MVVGNIILGHVYIYIWLSYAGFPTILAQFPNTPQFRPAGWFCVAFGVVLLLFHGEHSWHVRRICTHCFKMKPSFKKEKDKRYKDLCCQIFVSMTLCVFIHVANPPFARKVTCSCACAI